MAVIREFPLQRTGYVIEVAEWSNHTGLVTVRDERGEPVAGIDFFSTDEADEAVIKYLEEFK